MMAKDFVDKATEFKGVGCNIAEVMEDDILREG
jgi:hypothetical protein